MWHDVARFELRYQLRQPLFAFSALVFFGLGLALASSDIGVAIGDAPGTTLRNAPIVIARLMPVLSLLGLFAITAFVANAALRDFDRRSDMLFFTKPLRPFEYLSGRLAGSLAVSLLVLLAAVGGLMAGALAPWQPDDRVGLFSFAPYAFGTAAILIPNLLAMGGLFFALALVSRRLSVTFLCVVFFIGMQDAVEVLAQNLESRTLGSLLEPSGIVALETVGRYWTVAEQNTRLPELGGLLLANRLAWLGLAVVVLLLCVSRFDFTARERRAKRRPESVPEVEDSNGGGVTVPRIAGSFRRGDGWGQLLLQTRLEISEVIPRAPFLTLLAFGLMFVGAYSWMAGAHLGMPSYPLTHLMLEAIQLGVRLTLALILVFYAGELMFSQRSLELSQVYDALPVPNRVFLGAKLLALIAVAGVFLLAASVLTVAVQLAKGFAPDLALYAQGLVVLAVPLVPLIVLALFFQALTNHKLIGLLLMVLVLLTRFALPQLGFENNLALYGSHPPITYTAQGGYGHHAEPFGWFMLYWGLAAVALATATLMLWPRGTQGPLRERLAVARGRLSRPALARPPLVMMSLALLGMAATGGWIYVNTNLRNEYLDRDRIPQKLADYERQYAEYRDLPLPRVTRVFTEVDLFPETRRAELRGRFSLENQGAVPVQLLPISISPRWVEGVLPVYGGVTLEAVELPEHRVVLRDDELGFHLYELERPLAPGEAFELGFTVRVDHSAFANRRHNNLLVENGTFFSNANFLPTVGYARSNQMRNPTERRKRGLPEIARVADLDDADAHQRNYLEADWIAFEAILSTPSDQIALAPGNLEREWTEGGRRYFHYKTHAPITNLLPFLSGRYEVARDRWQHVDIEVYYHPDHAFNVERFSSVTRHSLEYMTRHFGPYAHDQLRIVEIPRYHGQVAFAFAQTIPFSESWCFTANVEAAELDWLSAIHAHEVSHQWWNHQVIPADVQGATLISEALAQYSSMMILEEIYGEEEVRRFLRHHLDRYLVGRGNERVREMPLARVENQDYIHYGKGSLALYALEDAIGEARLNRALRAFIDAFAYQGPPYPTSRDLLAHLRQEVPAEHQGLLEDLFETITLYDNRILSATAEPQDDGSYRVTLETQTVKLRDDGHGHTTELGVDESIEFGVFGEPLEGRETVLALEKRHVRDARQTGSRASTFTFVVDERPVRAGIDPYHKLIDRDADDNLLAVKVLSPRR